MRLPVLIAITAATVALSACSPAATEPQPPTAPAAPPVPTVADDSRPPGAALLIGPAAQYPGTGPTDADTLTIGDAATDTVGGLLPGDTMLSPFEVSTPILELLDPALLDAVQQAARRAAADGVEMRITSGWRSRGFQQRLLDDGVRTYGGLDAARQFVATPEVSRHVVGEAIDIGPTTAAEWMIANGRRFGLCQIFANENWHFELATDERGECPPLRPNAAG
ncbi:M15 family metallopeptidase [Mycolicibacterium arseniciresistens]|jgi:zinc D-Ala-D-Ala carboxypeptidase|uniref:M15 family metallopeptidase n=1 Tax=Mycolicibacterium arseniciresistens TaxID=3062257 RepID=A0ABT8UQV4_9MYCO|nr:M15 family metallopeptidase [Mycolicibacterium arseniciresistens]MDO3639210.1 M15 family metallopeptidase [Mycolicibacterium arseniciresistens]